MLEVRHLKKSFDTHRRKVDAVDDVSFTVGNGEWVGLVGESGSGKSTVAGMIAGTVGLDGGTICFDGTDYTAARGKRQAEWYRKMQMIFQSPSDSFDPRRTLGYSMTEGLKNRKVPLGKAVERAEAMMEKCGLSADYMKRYPHQVSGGECQRAAVARALLLEPKLLICDEITSALDVTVQAQIVELLGKLKREQELSCLFISHDLALVCQICSRILVMYQGKIIEQGTADEVILSPRETYTRKLLDSVPDFL